MEPFEELWVLADIYTKPVKEKDNNTKEFRRLSAQFCKVIVDCKPETLKMKEGSWPALNYAFIIRYLYTSEGSAIRLRSHYAVSG
jgi:hypothetical protein